MTIQDNAILLDRLTAALEAVNACLIDASNPLGRDYHKRAADALTKVTGQFHTIIRAERAMADANATVDEATVDMVAEAFLEATLCYEIVEYFTQAVNHGNMPVDTRLASSIWSVVTTSSKRSRLTPASRSPRITSGSVQQFVTNRAGSARSFLSAARPDPPDPAGEDKSSSTPITNGAIARSSPEKPSISVG